VKKYIERFVIIIGLAILTVGASAMLQQTFGTKPATSQSVPANLR
jgi:hypothetical protein